jgi:hypothetical protein
MSLASLDTRLLGREQRHARRRRPRRALHVGDPEPNPLQHLPLLVRAELLGPRSASRHERASGPRGAASTEGMPAPAADGARPRSARSRSSKRAGALLSGSRSGTRRLRRRESRVHAAPRRRQRSCFQARSNRTPTDRSRRLAMPSRLVAQAAASELSVFSIRGKRKIAYALAPLAFTPFAASSPQTPDRRDAPHPSVLALRAAGGRPAP